jgi:hypothetical protein
MPGRPLAERRADFATAWHALGHPEPTLAATDLSDGQLRVRIRAWEREQAWAPPWAADALRTAETARHAATLTEAEHRPEDAEQHRAEAAPKTAAAQHHTTLDQRRTQWATTTAPTRATAETADTEAQRHGLDLDHEPDRTTPTTPTPSPPKTPTGPSPHRPAPIEAADLHWATHTIAPAPASPEIPHHTPDTSPISPDTARTTIRHDTSVLELETLLAETILTTHLAAAEATQTQDQAEHHATQTAQAGRRRHETMDTETTTPATATKARQTDASVLYE